MLLTGATPAVAATVELTVTNIRNDQGHVLAAVCTQVEFLKPTCALKAGVPAQVPETHLRVEGVPPGTYAIEIYHDENDNRRIDRNFLGLPTEGMGFSNNAPFRFGPPSFGDARVDVAGGTVKVSIRLRYF